MEQRAERLSFGDTSAASLVAMARTRLTEPENRSWEEIEAAIDAQARHLVERNGHLVEDAPARQWLATASLVLAAFRELEPLAGSVEAISILPDALTAPFKSNVTQYLANRFGIEPDAPAEAFDRIAENFKRRGEERFGKAFIYFQDIKDSDRSFTNIRRCFFNDFFRANGAAAATPIFCTLDKCGQRRSRKDRTASASIGRRRWLRATMPAAFSSVALQRRNART